MTRQSSRFWITISLGLVFIAGLTSCNGPSSTPSRARASGPPPSVPVTVAQATKEDLPVYLSGLGSVQAYYTVSLKSRVDGQLTDVKFREGEHVNKGDLLAVIDPRPYQVQLEQAQATLFKDQASLRDAQLNYQRYKDLLQSSGAMSQQQVDTQKATVDQLQGAVQNDQAIVDNAKLNLAYCHITAPVSGRVGLRMVDPGNMVHATDANPMLVITQLQPITTIFTLPEDQLPTVAQQMHRHPLEVDAYSRDNSTKLASGKLLTIDNQIDQTTGTGKLKAVFSNEDSVLWPNQFVNVRLLLETRKNATVVPAAAVQRGPQGDFVYVVKADKTVEARDVKVALTEGMVSQIASGVSPDETIVTDGQDKLQNGSHVVPSMRPGAQNAGGPDATNPTAVPDNTGAPTGTRRSEAANRGQRNRRPSAPGAQNPGTSSE